MKERDYNLFKDSFLPEIRRIATSLEKIAEKLEIVKEQKIFEAKKADVEKEASIPPKVVKKKEKPIAKKG